MRNHHTGAGEAVSNQSQPPRMHNAPFGTGSHRKMSSLLGDQNGGNTLVLQGKPITVRDQYPGGFPRHYERTWMRRSTEAELKTTGRRGLNLG